MTIESFRFRYKYKWLCLCSDRWIWNDREQPKYFLDLRNNRPTIKELRIYSVLNNHTKERLLPLVQNNIAINVNVILNLNDKREEFLVNTSVYSDIFATYQLMILLN